jgi:hypothetical protein
LGEPLPSEEIFPGVAFPVIHDATWAGVAVGLPCRKSAAAPETCGAAIDVPLFDVVPVSLAFESDTMPVKTPSPPGA